MAILQLKEKCLTKFRPKRRIGLRSPVRTKRILRWAIKNDYRAVQIVLLGWGYMVSMAILLYACFHTPALTDVLSWLGLIAKVLSVLLALLNFYDGPVTRTRKSWKVHRRRAKFGLPVQKSA